MYLKPTLAMNSLFPCNRLSSSLICLRLRRLSSKRRPLGYWSCSPPLSGGSRAMRSRDPQNVRYLARYPATDPMVCRAVSAMLLRAGSAMSGMLLRNC
eukprot:1366700-Rhodomonas_salina.2